MDPQTAGWALVVALFLPLVGAGLLALIPARLDQAIRQATVVITGVAFVLVALITASFDFGDAGTLQFQTDVEWITAIGANFHLALDGISLPLFFLTYLLTFLCAIYTLKILPPRASPRASSG
jgi:NADH-quinone oxidoreductase subunit M